MKWGSTVLVSYSYNNVILTHASILTLATVHHLRYHACQFVFVLHTSLNIPRLQSHHFHMPNEVDFYHSNAHSYNNVILIHVSILTTIHHLHLCLAYQFVFHASLNIPRRQYYQFYMPNEAGYYHTNVAFI